ncbi:MAG: GatB/YqeY domain-containing protein [Alphaproteobacteria bacterium]|nr:GatB/YqeY domain-containing protein [Alphaproteobacteria bacterium]
MDKRTEFNNTLKEAMKNKNEVAVATTRLILAALKDRDIAARGSGKEVGEGEILSMLQSMIKQRNESTKTYRDAGREDLASREEAEIKVIEGFLPQQLGEAETGKIIEDIIKATGATGIKDMGKVMGELKGKYAGQVDMAKAGALVKQKLG